MITIFLIILLVLVPLLLGIHPLLYVHEKQSQTQCSVHILIENP
ncbi:hypothetical protein [Ferdinandcohnia sp. SAFN-114]